MNVVVVAIGEALLGDMVEMILWVNRKEVVQVGGVYFVCFVSIPS